MSATLVNAAIRTEQLAGGNSGYALFTSPPAPPSSGLKRVDFLYAPSGSIDINQRYMLGVGLDPNSLGSGSESESSVESASFTLPDDERFLLGSTFIYVNNIYQSFTSYTESADCTTVTFDDTIAGDAPVEIRYIEALIS